LASVSMKARVLRSLPASDRAVVSTAGLISIPRTLTEGSDRYNPSCFIGITPMLGEGLTRPHALTVGSGLRVYIHQFPGHPPTQGEWESKRCPCSTTLRTGKQQSDGSDPSA
jgi:hypothetical protein